MSEPSVGRSIAAELVGTFVVVLAGPGLLVLGDDAVGPLEVAIGSGIAMAIAIGVIGAVANPMFSLALWFSREISRTELLTDWVGQLVGGVLGGAVLFGLHDMTRYATGINGWEPADEVPAGVELPIHLSGFADLGVVVAAELVLGTVLVVVLLSAIGRLRGEASVAAFVGAAYGLATLLLVGISGAGVNPARSIGTALFADTDPGAIGQLWPFVVVPLVAAFTGTMIWLVVDEAEIDDTVFDDTLLDDAADAVAELVDRD